MQPLALELRQGPLDLAVFYLDDGVVAGDVSAVSATLLHVQQRAASFRLCLNLAQCAVVTPGRAGAADFAAALPATLLRTHDGNDRVLHNFEFLGASVGDDTFVAEHTRARVQKAMPLLDAIAKLPDPQVALRLLRACAGHARLVHSMRCNPPLPQQAALDHFDCLVRGCFSSFAGLHLEQSQWLQATRSLSQAGLGLRSASLDAPAAYMASVGRRGHHCSVLDPSFGAPASMPTVLAALSAYNQSVAHHLTADQALTQTQKTLTGQTDLAAWQQQLDRASPAHKALLLSEAEPGGRAFLAAVPVACKRLEPALTNSRMKCS